MKRQSKWLTKSIKPTQAKVKTFYPTQKIFKQQFKMMFNAVEELNNNIKSHPKANIINRNFLNINNKKPLVDMLITSPPYVTSYEYADLHQLSTLWLGYVKDYKELRQGTIGSLYHRKIKDVDIEQLNLTAKNIYADLKKVKSKRNPKSVVKYFLDMKTTIVLQPFLISMQNSSTNMHSIKQLV